MSKEYIEREALFKTFCPNCGAKWMEEKEDKTYIADVSWGRDSLAMLLYILDHPETYPLSEVVFYNTGMEFEAIYKIRDKMLPILRERGIKYTELHPENPFIYDMLERPVESKQKGKHNGYGWCGGVCRWAQQKRYKPSTHTPSAQRYTILA